MQVRLSWFLNGLKKPLLWLFKTRNYRPLVLRFGELAKINPLLLFVILFSCSFIFKNIPGINLTNSLGISYVIAYLIWFSRKAKAYLRKLRPSLKITPKEFQYLLDQSGRYKFYRFLFVSLLSPLLVFIVNYNALDGHFEITDQLSFLGLELSKWFAIITGTLLLQMNYITITEAIRFKKIEKKYAIVDVLDLHKLDSFSHLGIAAAMSIIGLFTVIPISILNEPELMTSLFSTLFISFPLLLINLTIPLYGIYKEIGVKLKIEKKLIGQALNNDKSSLEQLAIYGKQSNISTLDLIAYRTYINNLSPLPIAQNKIIKFLSSFILLILSWIVPYYYEAMIEVLF